MKRLYLYLWLVALTFYSGLVILVPSKIVYAAGKVSPTPGLITIAEGSSGTVSIAIDEPIITPGGDPNLYLHLSSTQPSRVTFSPEIITYIPSEWMQAKTFNVSVTDDSEHNANNTVPVTITAVSASEYYNGYVAAVNVTISDNDPEPQAPSVPASSEPPTQAPVPKTTKPNTTSQKIIPTPATSTTPDVAVAEPQQIPPPTAPVTTVNSTSNVLLATTAEGKSLTALPVLVLSIFGSMAVMSLMFMSRIKLLNPLLRHKKIRRKPSRKLN